MNESNAWKDFYISLLIWRQYYNQPYNIKNIFLYAYDPNHSNANRDLCANNLQIKWIWNYWLNCVLEPIPRNGYWSLLEIRIATSSSIPTPAARGPPASSSAVDAGPESCPSVCFSSPFLTTLLFIFYNKHLQTRFPSRIAVAHSFIPEWIPVSCFIAFTPSGFVWGLGIASILWSYY